MFTLRFLGLLDRIGIVARVDIPVSSQRLNEIVMIRAFLQLQQLQSPATNITGNLRTLAAASVLKLPVIFVAGDLPVSKLPVSYTYLITGNLAGTHNTSCGAHD